MDRELTLVEHLSELRGRVIFCLIALGITCVTSFIFVSDVLKILKLPAAGLIDRLVYFSPEESLLIYMRISFSCGFVLSMPAILYQIWAFCSPALEEKTKRHSVCFILSCFLSFVVGGLFAFFILIPPALRFCFNFAKDDFEPLISASKYISFVVNLIIASGLMFQMPVASFVFTRIGIINAGTLRSKYKYAFVAILILAAVITPTTDIFNMMVLAVPMLFLYEISIWVSYLAKRPNAAVQENGEKELLK